MRKNTAKASSVKGSNGAPVAVEMLPIDDLVPYEKNARSHPPAQIAKLAASIREFGFIVPCIIDKDNVIIAGHGRVEGAKEAGHRLAPCIRAEHLTEAQVKAFRLMDNRVSQDASWLDDILADELKALESLDFDLSLTGFDDKELQALLIDEAELARAEETPPVPENPVTVKGDVWVLGKHRIVCGDSTVATDVEKCLNGVKPHLMVTDPPYGVSYDPSWRAKLATQKPGTSLGTVKNDDRSDWTEAWQLFPGSIAYIWHGGLHSGSVLSSIEACGFQVRSQIIWVKQGFVFGRSDYHWQHEPCWYAVKGTGSWHGDRKQTTIWEIKNLNRIKGGNTDEALTGHGTQKPVECMLRPINNNSSAGQAVYEPFSGSGTTIIAGEMSGRCVHAIELNEAYVDVAVLRWQQFAGGNAILEGDGRTFDEIKQERHGKQGGAAEARAQAQA